MRNLRSWAEAAAPEAAPWGRLIPPEQWAVFDRVIGIAQARRVGFAIGGGLAFSHYARRWRNTKDMDLYVRPEEREAMIACTIAAGLVDYFDVHDYDRAWIYRAHDRAGTIVDIIWQMANGRARVDAQWLCRGELLEVNGRAVRILPPEELIWSKLYVVQRERCDWGDLLNILHELGGELDWDWLIARVGEDRRLLASLVEMFTWACPEQAQALPMNLWERLQVARPHAGDMIAGDPLRNVKLLDSRDWFGANQERQTN